MFATKLIAVWLALGCAPIIREATIYQENPLDTRVPPYISAPAKIDTRDHELPSRFKLRQHTFFVVTSKDRLKFRVIFTHKWEEIANVNNWRYTLDIDGKHFYPTSQESYVTEHISRVWDEEPITTREHRALTSIDVFVGTGEVNFAARNIFSRQTHTVQLTAHNDCGFVYKFKWELSNE